MSVMTARNRNGAMNTSVDEFIKNYDAQVSDLRGFPDKPMINALTMVAEEKHWAPHIVNFLWEKIQRVAPDHKLPIFYLMDSIMKNIGSDYITLFKKVIVPVFCHCIDQVPTEDHWRFTNVLKTWEAEGMFPPDVMFAMREKLRRQPQVPSVLWTSNQQPVVNAAQQMMARRAIAPPDPRLMANAKRRRVAPPQLPGQLDGDAELRRLLVKLQHQMNIPVGDHMSLEEVLESDPHFYQQLLSYRATQNAHPTPLRAMRPPKRPVPTPPAAPAVDTAAVLSILQKLNTPKAPQPSSIGIIEVKPSKDRIEMNVSKLYGDRKHVAPQSGVRFKEAQQLNEHLDFLFQLNRAKKEKSRGTTSRSWYPTQQQWETDFKGGFGGRGETTKSFFEVQNDKDQQEAEEQTSKVPADESITKCRICGESLEKFWDEDEEEWMYRNAIYGIIEGATPGGSSKPHIFHTHCYRSATWGSSAVSVSQLAPGTPQSPIISEFKGGWKDAIDETQDKKNEEKEEVLTSSGAAEGSNGPTRSTKRSRF